MASPDRVYSNPMVLAPPDPVTTKVEYVFIHGSTPMFSLFGTPGEAVPVPRVFGDGWTVEAWARSGNTYATVKDTATFDGETAPGSNPTPNDSNIPPVSDLELQYDV